MSPATIADRSLTEQLVGLLREPISDEARRCAALRVLDWIGCAAAGARGETGRVLAAHVARLPHGFVRTISGARLTALDASFADGSLGSLIEMDDVHRRALLHPGPVVIPAVLALAAERRRPGRAVLDAVVRGYEAMIRLGLCLGPGHYRHFHNTATCGPLGAAAAAADLLGLSEDATVNAIGNAMTQSGGLWQCRNEPVMTKALHTARSARAGLESALLAELGFSGPRFILEGPQGFFAAMAPEGHLDRLLADRGGRWLIEETSLKPWPACRHVHAAIDAALRLRPEIDGCPITEVLVRTYGDAITLCDRAEPRDAGEARFSLQHAVAVVLAQGRPVLDDFAAPQACAPATAALRGQVRLARSPHYDARYPAHFGTGLTVRLADGAVLEADIADAWGDPENPMHERDVHAKAAMLLGTAGFSDRQIRRVIELTSALSECDTLEALRASFSDADDGRVR